MENEKSIEPNVKLTAYVPPEVREKVEAFGQKTIRNLSQSVQFLLETHPELQPKNQTDQIALDK